MRTWEMIKELTEDPEKEFRREDGLILAVDYYGTLRWEPGKRHFNIDDQWEEVKDPVNFIEVVKATKEGSRVGLVYDKFSIKFSKWGFRDLMIELGEDFTDEDLAEIILNGKWYIED